MYYDLFLNFTAENNKITMAQNIMVIWWIKTANDVGENCRINIVIYIYYLLVGGIARIYYNKLIKVSRYI